MPQESNLGGLERLMERWEASIHDNISQSFDENARITSSLHDPNRCPHCDSIRDFSCKDELCQFGPPSITIDDNRVTVSDSHGNSRAVIGDIRSVPTMGASDVWGTAYGRSIGTTLGESGFWSISNR